MKRDMKCSQARSIIETSPLSECQDSERADLERHARDCDACRAALTRAAALDAALGELPQPEPPAALAAAISARIATLDSRPRGASEAPAVPVGAVRPDERYAWAAVLAGAAVGIGAQALSLASGESSLRFGLLLFRGSLDSLLALPAASPTAVVLALGLGIYAAGLFASLRS